MKISGSFPEVTVDFYYIVGSDQKEEPNGLRSANRVKQKVKSHLSKAKVNYSFINAAALWEQIQSRPPRDKALIWAETPMIAQEGYVGLVKLKDYYEFLQDAPGILAERIFESNVRGFQGGTSVNVRLRESTRSPGKANFWLLNNGITIICPRVQSAGHLRISVEDPQIVNGLQTSREIFDYFTETKQPEDDRSVLVRVIETANDEVSDLIIRATNSQNKMSESSLRMTDNIHRKIEELFKQHGLFYDRRKGHHKDQGIPIANIVSATTIAQAAMSIMLWRPDDARARPGDYFKDEDKYLSIFPDSDKVPISVYVNCVNALRKVSTYLREKEIDKADGKNLQFYVLATLSSQITSRDLLIGSINNQTPS